MCIDPYLSDAVEEFTGKKRIVPPPIRAEDINANAVVCTHNHLDHLDIKIIDKLLPTVFFAPSDCKNILKECGAGDIAQFNEGDKAVVGDIGLEAVYANHTVPAIGIIVTCEGKKLYFSGDTYYDKKLENLKEYNIDYAFICINGKLGNMNVDEAVYLTKKIHPNIAIPNHYGMFLENTEDPMPFLNQLDNGFIMEVGREYEVSECLI